MVANGYFGHDTPTGVEPVRPDAARGLHRRGIVWNASETIAWASGSRATPRSVMDAWLDSTSQRLTLLAPDFRDIGVGIALGAPVERAAGRRARRHLHGRLRLADVGEGPAHLSTQGGEEAPARPSGAAMRAKCHGLEARGALVR